MSGTRNRIRILRWCSGGLRLRISGRKRYTASFASRSLVMRLDARDLQDFTTILPVHSGPGESGDSTRNALSVRLHSRRLPHQS
jgi:hypothetical protein